MKAILVLNAGSSSLKFALFELTSTVSEKPMLSGQVEGIGAQPMFSAKTAKGEKTQEPVICEGAQSEQHRDALAHLFNWLKANHPAIEICAAGHRVVHGGERFSTPVQLTEETMAVLETFVPLAPLHQPHNLRAIKTVSQLLPSISQVACFDTAFHRTQPAVSQAFGLPRAISAEGVKRYGFHGLSYDYIARQLPHLLGEKIAQGSVIIAHLGNGASMCALRNMQSIATTMGFTALDGLMMGTRTGNIDPGVLLYLLEQKKMDVKQLSDLLYKKSGLLGVSEVSQDMRALLAAQDQAPAQEAVELFCYRIARELGSLAAAAQGCDALIFTGGIGEHAAPIRERVAELSAWLGISIDKEANQQAKTRIDTPDSKVAVAVIPTNEEWMIAGYTQQILGLPA